MTQPIWFDSTEAGAPTLNNVAGSLLEVLRSCLVNGFNAKTVTSIAVASGVATATCAAHGFLGTYGKLVQISGATEPLLNGPKQPGGVLTNSFTFPAPGVADGTYTGTMSAKRAPLGWAEVYSAGNVSIFSRTAPEATVQMLRINDSHANGSTATDARVIIVESATGVDTYTAASPTTAQVSGGGYWHKGVNSAAAKPWVIVGNDRFLWVLTSSDANYLSTGYFGDGVPYFTPDAFFSILAAGTSAGGGTTGSATGGRIADLGSTIFSTAQYAPRARTGLGTCIEVQQRGPAPWSVIGASAGGQTSLGNIALHYPAWVVENDGSKTIRGHVPGLVLPLAGLPFTHLQVLQAGTPEKQLLSLRHAFGGTQGNLLIDLSGPWF